MSRPRNFVSELKDSAKVFRAQAGLPDDFSGWFWTEGNGGKTCLQYQDGFLCGAIWLPDDNLAGFAKQVASMLPQEPAVEE